MEYAKGKFYDLNIRYFLSWNIFLKFLIKINKSSRKPNSFPGSRILLFRFLTQNPWERGRASSWIILFDVTKEISFQDCFRHFSTSKACACAINKETLNIEKRIQFFRLVWICVSSARMSRMRVSMDCKLCGTQCSFRCLYRVSSGWVFFAKAKAMPILLCLMSVFWFREAFSTYMYFVS